MSTHTQSGLYAQNVDNVENFIFQYFNNLNPTYLLCIKDSYSYETLNKLMIYFLFRNPNQSTADHGQIRAGPVRTVQPGHCAWRSCRRHQQETVAGDHQGTALAVQHHQRRVHVAHAVSF